MHGPPSKKKGETLENLGESNPEKAVLGQITLTANAGHALYFKTYGSVLDNNSMGKKHFLRQTIKDPLCMLTKGFSSVQIIPSIPDPVMPYKQ